MKKEKKQVSCDEIQQKIKAYILGKMELPEACEFVGHIRHCEKCREELEVYYAFSSALSPLDQNEEITGKFSENIEKRLEKTETAAVKAKKELRIKWMVYVAVALLVAAATGVTFGV